MSHYEIPKIQNLLFRYSSPQSQNKPIIWYLDKFEKFILKCGQLYIIRYLEALRFLDLGRRVR